LDNDTIGAVKDSLVRSPDKHDDQLTCDFDIRLSPSG
jgi:hypothetical protein